MSNQKHTPGPWSVLIENGKLYVVQKHQDPVTVCFVPDPSSEDSQADARLIATAPELLAACKDAYAKLLERLNFIESTYGLEQNKDAYLNQLEQAIAKATGGAE